MKDWVKLKAYERLYQAEIRKQVLEQNEIEVVIINEKDSLFLLGEIDLYVKKDDKLRAGAILDEFDGIVKINSFFMAKPVLRFQRLLTDNGIQTYLRQKEDSQYILDNYELYVTTDDLEKVIPFLNGEKLAGWSKIDSVMRTRQTRFRVEILEENNIDTLVIKKRNTDYHVEEINIYVNTKQLTAANRILTLLNGWLSIDNYTKLHLAEIREDLLGKNNIRALIKNEDNKYYLYVEAHNEEIAIDIINKHKQWTKIGSYTSLIQGNYVKNQLAVEEIDSVLVAKEDPILAIASYDLYVDGLKTERTLEILTELENLEE